MDISLEIAFHNVPPPEAIERRIRERVIGCNATSAT
jgi:hypothetical protein